MEDLGRKVNMKLYILQEGDIKKESQKWSIIPNKLYIIGRSKKDADIVVDEKLLSRKHAELIYYDNTKILIKDLDSRNGTYLNKERIEPLKDKYFTIKDVLSFGNINNELVFYETNEGTMKKESDLEKDERIIKNYEKYDRVEKKSYPKDYKYNKKYYSEKEYYSNNNRQSKHFSKKSLSKSRNERSRSRETYNEQSRPYSKNNNYMMSSRGRNEKEYEKTKYEKDNRNKYYENDNRNKYSENDNRNKYSENDNRNKYSENDNRNMYSENDNRKNGRISNDQYSEKYRDYERKTGSRPINSKEDYERGMMEERNSIYRRSQRSKNYENEEEEFMRDKVFLNVDKIERMENDKNLEDAGFVKCYVSGYMMLNIKKSNK